MQELVLVKLSLNIGSGGATRLQDFWEGAESKF